MKKQVIHSIFVVGVCMWMTGALVYSQSLPKLVADIPFEFHVGQAMLPAGAYIVNREGNDFTNILKIQNATTGKSAFTFTMPGSSANSPNQAKLIFNRYGSDYFLSKVCNPYSWGTYQLPKSKTEKEIARNALSEKAEVVAQKR